MHGIKGLNRIGTKKIASILICGLIFNLLGAGMAVAADTGRTVQADTAVNNAISYLHSMQNADGGFPARADYPSSREISDWVLIALAAAGEDLTQVSWAPAGNSPLDYLHNSEPVLNSTTDYARTLLALCAVKADSGGQNTDLAEKLASLQQENGQFALPGEEGLVNAHMWAVLALAAAEQDIPDAESAREWLLKQQHEDGGFSWGSGIASDADDTAIALQVLVLLGEDPTQSVYLEKALQYLHSCRTADGGFCSGWAGEEANLNSSAWVLQALLAVGDNPRGNAWVSTARADLMNSILSLQADDGYFEWTRGVKASPVNNTAYALIALLEKPFPVNVDYIGAKDGECAEPAR